MHLLLAGSLACIIKERPFHNLVDRRCWCYSLLSLACVTHLSSMFKVGEPWSDGYMVTMIFLFVLPVLGMITGKINHIRDHKDSHEAIRHKQKEQAKHGHWMVRRATKKISCRDHRGRHEVVHQRGRGHAPRITRTARAIIQGRSYGSEVGARGFDAQAGHGAAWLRI
jgi:hypothetical protein